MKLRPGLKKRIHEKLSQFVAKKATPGAQLALGWKNHSLGFFCSGVADPLSQMRVQPTTLFDISSLTKIVCTVSLWMKEFQKNSARQLQDPLKTLFPSFSSALKEKTIEDLLNHRAGLSPLFEKTEELTDRQQRVRFFLNEVDKSYEPKEEIKTVYSDIDFMLLGIALEQIHGQRLREIFPNQPNLCFGPISMSHFLSRHLFRRPFAASLLSLEGEPQWMNGEVQDPRSQWLGGDAGHAGLFANASAIESWGRELYLSYYGKSLDLSDKVVRTFIDFEKKSDNFSENFLGGFDTPAPGGLSQAGSCFSDQSIGHLGFSGASFWMDLQSGARITLLTHRHFKGGDPDLIKKERPLLHDWLMHEVFFKI